MEKDPIIISPCRHDGPSPMPPVLVAKPFMVTDSPPFMPRHALPSW